MWKLRFAWCMALVFVSLSLQAKDWPNIPQAHWDLQTIPIPGYPDAPAVVLLRSGNLVFDERGTSSVLEVFVRIKILKEEGRGYGTVSVPSSRYYRIKQLEARTVLPGGRVVEMGDDAKFEKKYSSYSKYKILSFALPAVEPGAIVEWRYSLFFDSIIRTEPWYFQSELPTLRSEVTFEYPLIYGVATVPFSPLGQKIEQRTERLPKAQRFFFAMENAPPIPDEPARYPFEDLASWVLCIPQSEFYSGTKYDLLNSWERAIEILDGDGNRDRGYLKARRKAGNGRAKAKALISGLKNPEKRAQAIYYFVRDQIRNDPWLTVSVHDRSGDQVLKSGEGSSADKAVLLHTMLKEAKVKARLGWARARDQGHTHQQLYTPFQFTDMVVVAEYGGQQIFLDPAGPKVPFGVLRPNLEDLPILLINGKKPEWVTSPHLPISDNARRAKLYLEVSPEGAVSGRGELVVSGHRAQAALEAAGKEESPEEYWSDWLEGRFSGYEVAGLEVAEQEGRLEVQVKWTLQQREEEVLGDEVSLRLAAPLGLTSNFFSLPPGQRRTPVLLDYAFASELEVRVEWPEGWQVEAQPRLKELTNGAGSLAAAVRLAPEGGSLVASRQLALANREFVGNAAYGQLHQLWATAAANDSETLILVRE